MKLRKMFFLTGKLEEPKLPTVGKSISISKEDLFFSIFPNLKCHNCGMYKRNYHCFPMFYKTGEKLISKYKNISLLIFQSNFEHRIPNLQAQISNPYLVLRHACAAEVQVIKKEFNNYLDSLFQYYSRKKIDFKLFGYGGGCLGCRKCGCLSGESCRHKNKHFRAPESIGIDVYKTLENLSIEFEIIPETEVTLVGLLCQTKCD